PITKLKLIGIPLAFLGVCIVFFEHGVEFNNTLLGDLILVFGVLGWALYSVQGKPLSTRYGALQVTTLAISLGTVTFIPVMPHYLSRVDYGAISPLAWASLAYMAVLTSAVAYTLWYWLMGQMETGKVAVLQNLQPVFTILFTALLVDAGWAGLFAIQGHAITPVFLAGAALTLAGVLITQRG
ncbi:MAG TPA: DMT family transporter, partial [bacterium]|nr:DMT family transporter [bacterium]